MTVKSYVEKHTHTLTAKRVAISGSTGGIGRQLCRHLASLGATLIMLDRNSTRSLALADELKAEFPDLACEHIRVDMEDIASVKAATEKLLEVGADFLILNAGAYSIPRKICDTGYDNVFQINFIAPYYMARKLYGAISQRGGRIVAVGSIAHNYSKTDVNDVDFRTREKASLVYGNAKRHLMYSLSDFDSDGIISITHPGITFTNITAHYPKLIFALIKHPMKIIFMSPRRASLSILLGLFENTEGSSWIGPRLFNVWGLPKNAPLSTAAKEEREHISRVAEDIFREING